MKKYLAIFLISYFISSAQKINTDSLLNIISKKETPDSTKCKLYYQLGKNLYSSQPEQALNYAEKSISIAQKIGNKKIEAEAISIIGVIYKNKGDFTTALRQQIKALKIKESTKDTLGLAISNNDIGIIYKSMKQFDLAIQYYRKSNALCLMINYPKGIIMTYNNIGTIHSELSNYDSTQFYYKKALAMAEKINNKHAMATCLSNLGEFYATQKKHTEALKYFERCLELDTENNDAYGMMLSNTNIAGIYIDLEKFDLAKKYLIQAEKLALEIDAKPILKDIYASSSQMYKKIGDYTKAYEYLSKYSQIKDSILNIETTGQIAELQTKYDTEKKEQENKLLSAKNDLSAETIKRQKIFSYFIITALILAAGLAFFIFRGLKQQRVANKMISLQKQQVEHKNHIIEEKQKEILDSINYAKRIQYALLAHDEFLNKYIPNHFVLFKPKDIVSGDFYWATQGVNKQNEELFYLAVCDSTGHGVPGAFMSLLSIGFLSEAIKEKDIFLPNDVFNYVRKRLIDSISNEQQKDGFDGILMCFNKTTGLVTYASSNNKPVLVNANSSELIELPGDKMPVGKGEVMDDFKLYTVNYQSGDSIYLYTDGYADQFGGPKGKKFKYKQLEDMLLQNSSKSLAEQKEILNQSFTNWQGALEQVDDVCVLGIKL